MASMLLSTIFQCAHDVERDTTSKKKKEKTHPLAITNKFIFIRFSCV